MQVRTSAFVSHDARRLGRHSAIARVCRAGACRTASQMSTPATLAGWGLSFISNRVVVASLKRLFSISSHEAAAPFTSTTRKDQRQLV